MRASLKEPKQIRRTIYMPGELANEFRAHCLIKNLKANEELQNIIKEWLIKQTKKKVAK